LEPGQIIADLCQRFGVSNEFGERLRPLVERAVRSEPDKRRRILDLIERSFDQEARRARLQTAQILSVEDKRVLTTVARVLHPWNPPRWLHYWEQHTRGARPEGEAS
jgi:hypothetical protein